ncbi:MAG TPA: carbohydrate binding family 9 domain-containing protein, partial [Flavitalea sp.]|nr:carbohydrate binding family 9 domain-containing protein [Flavitalea sp.]
MRGAFLIILIFVSFSIPVYSQQKVLTSTQISGSIRIDGNLDEAGWQTASIADSFITNSPVFGRPSVARTEVKVLYDNTAMYIGAYLHDDPKNIRRQFTARDQERQADVDYFSVFIDTYKDRQNGYQFLVTSRNVQSDARMSPNAPRDFGVQGDLSWDAVWDSKVTMRSDGWVVEMKIPYFSVRFTKSQIQEW